MGRLGSDYIPLVDGENTKFRLVISFSQIAWFTVSLPFFGFIFCIIWSILYNFEQATKTHCNVYNFLPSVSAAIGHYKPQKNVWELTISVQAAVRALVLLMYYRYYRETAYKWARGITNIALVSYLLENIALVTLTFWSSNHNYVFHKISFITFLLMSLIHMFSAYIIAKNCRNVIKDINEIRSLKWKYNSMVLNVAAILLACYFFYRHNKHCEPLEYLADKLNEGGRALDIGSGSGYLTTCMALMVGRSGIAVGIEHIPQLQEIAKKNIESDHHELLENGQILLIVGDGRLGYPSKGPYDAIHIGAATPEVSETLISQLASGGRMIVPIGKKNEDQTLYQIDKTTDGEIIRKSLMGVVYVPLTDKEKQFRS